MRKFYKDGKNNKLEWHVWVLDDQVHTSSGVVGGKLKSTYDVPGSVGVENTKSFVGPEAQAILVAERKVRKKIEEGYYEVGVETCIPLVNESISSINFVYLPKNLSFFKPQRWPDTKKKLATLEEILEDRRDIVTIKRDGMMHPILITDTKRVRIYSRRMDDCTDSYPHIVEELKKMDLPSKTVLTCEFVVDNNGDDRDVMSSISRSLPNRAVQRAAELSQQGMKTEAIILGVPFWAGESVYDRPVEDVFDLIESSVKPKTDKTSFISTIEIRFDEFEESKQHVIDKGLEGLVIYDSSAVFGPMAFNFRGRPERPSCWKWKPEFEDDFMIIFDPDRGKGDWGAGKIKGLPGNVTLCQLTEDGQKHFLCKCGSGFTEEQRKEVLEKASNSLTGVAGVGIIKYVKRSYISEGSKTNALREPVFVGWHPDKIAADVVNNKLKVS